MPPQVRAVPYQSIHWRCGAPTTRGGPALRPQPGRGVAESSRRGSEQPGILRHVDDVVLAGGGLQPGAVENRNLAALVMNKSLVAQRLGRAGDGGAAHAEHMAEQLLRERQGERLDAVTRH